MRVASLLAFQAEVSLSTSNPGGIGLRPVWGLERRSARSNSSQDVLWKTDWNVFCEQIAGGKCGWENLLRKPLPSGLNTWYLCSLDPPVNSLFPKFVVSVGFRVCFSSRASQDKVSSSNLRVNLQFPIGSVTAWLAGLKKIELSTICFTRSFCPLDTFSSFWPDKAYLSSGYEPIIQPWIEIYGHPFVPAHTKSLW